MQRLERLPKEGRNEEANEVFNKMDRGKWTEYRGQRTEDNAQRIEDKDQKTDNRGNKTEY